MKNKNIIVAVIVVVVALVILYVWYPRQQQVSSQQVKIGAILPLSGDFASFGEAINRGAILAVEEASGGGLNVFYINEDDQSTAVGTTNAANKLVRVDKVDAALTATVQEVKPAAPIFESADVPLLATWDSNNYIKTAGKSIFTIGFSTEGAGEKMASYARNSLKLSKVAVVAQIDEWSQLIASAFENSFKKYGGTVVISEKIQPTQKDFRTLLAKVKNSGAEGIYFPFLPNTIAPFLKQAKELGLKAVMMTGDSISPDEVAQAGTAAENLHFTNLYADNATNLVEKYKAMYGSEPADITFISFGYDGMKTLIAAVESGRKEGISTSDALRKLNIQGLDHRINFDGKQYSEKLERLYKVVDNQFVEVER